MKKLNGMEGFMMKSNEISLLASKPQTIFFDISYSTVPHGSAQNSATFPKPWHQTKDRL
jgi:hypothetical protein